MAINSAANFISTLYTKITTEFTSHVATYSESVATTIKPIITAVFALYIIYIIYRVYSKKDAIFEEFVDKLLLIAIIGAFTYGGGYYADIITFVTNAGDEIGKGLTGGDASSISAVDNVFNAFEKGIQSIKKQQDDAHWWDSFSGKQLNLIFSLFCLYLAQIIFVGIVAVNLIIAKIMVCLLLTVGVLFICFALFPATRNMFFSWVGLCFNYILLNVLYSAVALLAGNYIVNTFNAADTGLQVAAAAIYTLVTVVIIVLAVNQIPVFVSTLTGGVGMSAFTVSTSSFSKLANNAKSAISGAGKTAKMGFKGGRALGRLAAKPWKGGGKAS